MALQNVATPAAEAEAAPEIAATYDVTVEWQPEECYMALSDDIDGLVLQADSLEEMVECMLETIPVLLEFNHNTGEITQDRLSVRQVGTANPRGLTRYEIIQLA